ncbi:WD40-repeat-containing domain protein [Gautieria morchelliformis]|nr:WD40-repeat-containing domain protein [Gautieria morchelliformis]
MTPSTVSVHRCRFVDYNPTAITAIAFPPLPLPPVKGKAKETGASPQNFGVLAAGRANGNIELLEWSGIDRQAQASQAWVAKKVLPGPVPSKVDSLVFTLRSRRCDFYDVPQLKDLRLFSAGGGSEILEWDLESGGIVRSISSQGGSVWSMAANPSSTLLALGCEDGSVRIISLGDDSLTPHRRFDRVKSRLLCIAWGPPMKKIPPRREAGEDSSEEDEDDGWTDTWLVAGCSDSSLRKFDISSGRVLDRMTTDKARGERTLVWSIGVLGDGTIISGDSLGSVKFWDSSTCTLLQSFQTHGADVLCLAIGPGGKSVYTSGVDQKVCQFSKVPIATAPGNLSTATSFHSKWVHTTSRRLHSHDVRCIGIWPPYVPLISNHRLPALLSRTAAPILVSGGLDMSLVICPCALPSPDLDAVNPLRSGIVSTFEDAYHQRLPYTTGMSPSVQVAREAKLVLCRRDTGLTIWKIKKNASPGEVGLTDLEASVNDQGDGWEKLVDMQLKTRTNLVACAIADDGSWVSASDLYETKLFRLIHVKNEVRPKRVKLAGEAGFTAAGATSLLFTSDSSKLIVGACMGSSLVMVVDLKGESNNSPRVLRSFEQHRMRDVVVGGNTNRAMKNLPGSFDANGEVHHSEDESSEGIGEMTHLHSFSAPSVASTITCMATSMDGQWLASADTRHRIHVFNLDSVQHHCALPTFPHAVASLSFDPGSPGTLIVGLVNNTLQVFDVEARQFPEWSYSLSQTSSSPFSHLHDPLLGICFDPDLTSGFDADVGRRALLWGSSWMCKVKLGAPWGSSSSSKKRRRESRRLSLAADAETQKGADTNPVSWNAENDPNFRLVTRYRPLLLVEYLGPGELLVVERPLVDLLSTLPPAYFKATYGS